MYSLAAQDGLDLLVFALRTHVDVEVPLCASCGRRKTRGRVAWFAAILGIFFAACGVVPLVEALFPGAGPEVAGVGMAVLLPAGLGGRWWARNLEDRLYHRWFCPAWIVAFDKTTMIARVGFRDARTRRDVGVLSGVLEAGEGLGEAGYREHAAPVPAPFSPPARPLPLPWWSSVLLGLGAMGGGPAESLGLLGRRSGSLRTLNDLLDWLGGRAAVFVFWVAVGLAFVALGLVLRRAQKLDRRE